MNNVGRDELKQAIGAHATYCALQARVHDHPSEPEPGCTFLKTPKAYHLNQIVEMPHILIVLRTKCDIPLAVV